MATVTKPVALDETFNTTDADPVNIADVLKSGLSAIEEAIGGGSSEGGHTIQDASGTALAQRSALQFGGTLQASDDSANGKTVVTDEAEEIEWSVWNAMTEAEQNAYSAGKKLNILNAPVMQAKDVEYDNTTSGLSATDVQSAIDEVNTEKQDNFTSISYADWSQLTEEQKAATDYLITDYPDGGVACSANNVSYDNSDSGMSAGNMQSAMDEIAGRHLEWVTVASGTAGDTWAEQLAELKTGYATLSLTERESSIIEAGSIIFEISRCHSNPFYSRIDLSASATDIKQLDLSDTCTYTRCQINNVSGSITYSDLSSIAFSYEIVLKTLRLVDNA